jgi:hypothetical protein
MITVWRPTSTSWSAGPWDGALRENTFDHGIAPTSLLVAGVPTRYVLTERRTRLADGTAAAIYLLADTELAVPALRNGNDPASR